MPGKHSWGRKTRVAGGLVIALACCSVGAAQDLSAAKVKHAIDQGVRLLNGAQERNGAWPGGGKEHEVGVTSLAVLALINCGQPADQGAALRGLTYLRKVDFEYAARQNYDASLMLMALAAAKDANDLPRITKLAQELESRQLQIRGDQIPAGGWSYSARLNIPGGDPSNSQYAILALKEAADFGVPVDRNLWLGVQEYWTRLQNADGGWGYGRSQSTGSMTAAGIASLTIAQQMLLTDEDRGVKPDGEAPCCGKADDDRAIEKGIR